MTGYRYSLVAPRILEQLPMAERADAASIQVRTLFSAISPGTELAAYTGLPPLRETAKPYPRLVGYCNVGEVIAVPEGQEALSRGELVLTHACHGSHFYVTAGEILARIPRGADLPAATTTYLFHLGYAAALKGEIRAGFKVAVIGLGTLGLTSASLARLCGAHVTGFSSHIRADSSLAPFGIDEVRDKHAPEPDEFDVVVTTSNAWPDWKLAMILARRGGRIVVLGFPGRGVPAPDFNPLASRWFYDKQLTVTACGHTPSLDAEPIDVRFTLKRNCSYLLEEILRGRLPARDLIAEIRPASELAAVYEELDQDRRQGRTVVLDWTNSS